MTDDEKHKTAAEAHRILCNISTLPYHHGVTTVDVVDYFCEKYDTAIFCNGYLRKIVFTPITTKSYSFRTEAI